MSAWLLLSYITVDAKTFYQKSLFEWSHLCLNGHILGINRSAFGFWRGAEVVIRCNSNEKKVFARNKANFTQAHSKSIDQQNDSETKKTKVHHDMYHKRHNRFQYRYFTFKLITYDCCENFQCFFLPLIVFLFFL